MYACNSYSGNVNAGTVVKFFSVKASTGIRNLNSFKSTGKFVCEDSGFYMIAAVIMSPTDEVGYNIMNNDHIVLHIHPPSKTHGRGTTTTGVFLTFLNVKDTVFVQTEYTTQIYTGASSCISIFKI